MFALVDAVLLRPLPYVQPGRLVAVWHGRILSPAEYQGLAENPLWTPDSATCLTGAVVVPLRDQLVGSVRQSATPVPATWPCSTLAPERVRLTCHHRVGTGSSLG